MNRKELNDYGYDLLRYGQIISIKNIENQGYWTLRHIMYKDKLYEHLMCDGEVISVVEK